MDEALQKYRIAPESERIKNIQYPFSFVTIRVKSIHIYTFSFELSAKIATGSTPD